MSTRFIRLWGEVLKVVALIGMTINAVMGHTLQALFLLALYTVLAWQMDGE